MLSLILLFCASVALGLAAVILLDELGLNPGDDLGKLLFFAITIVALLVIPTMLRRTPLWPLLFPHDPADGDIPEDGTHRLFRQSKRLTILADLHVLGAALLRMLLAGTVGFVLVAGAIVLGLPQSDWTVPQWLLVTIVYAWAIQPRLLNRFAITRTVFSPKSAAERIAEENNES